MKMQGGWVCLIQLGKVGLKRIIILVPVRGDEDKHCKFRRKAQPLPRAGLEEEKKAGADHHALNTSEF